MIKIFAIIRPVAVGHCSFRI